MTTPSITELREAREAATQGEWFVAALPEQAP